MSLNTPKPLQEIRRFEKVYGSDRMQQLRAAYKTNSSLKNEKGTFLDVMKELHLNPINNKDASSCIMESVKCTANHMGILFAWERYKQVYKFDDDLFEALTEDTEEIIIAKSIIIDRSPFHSYYISHPIRDNELGYDGVFVNIDKLNSEIRLVFTDDERSACSYITIPFTEMDETVSIKRMIEDADEDVTDDMRSKFVSVVEKAFSLIIYLCTDKPDVSSYKSEMPLPDSKMKHTSRKKQTAKKKNYVTVSNVGNKIGRVIREDKRKSLSDNHGTASAGRATKKKPHMRKGHLHSYWIGKHGSADRKLVLKYIPPVFVHSEACSELEVTTRIRGNGKED